MVHNLKILPEYFEPVIKGIKSFEIRKDDRGYRVGDKLVLNEWNGERYTGRNISKRVVYITSYNQQPGYIVMSII